MKTLAYSSRKEESCPLQSDESRSSSPKRRWIAYETCSALVGGATQSNACFHSVGFGGRPERPSGGHQEWSQPQHPGSLYHQVPAIRTGCRAQRLAATGEAAPIDG